MDEECPIDTLVLGQHYRVGADSPLQMCDSSVLQIIAEHFRCLNSEYVSYNKDREEEWVHPWRENPYGKYRHRWHDRPAVIVRDSLGRIVEEEYWKNGLRHRDNDLPAYRSHTKLQWWTHGENIRSRKGKPIEVYVADGFIMERYSDGRCVSSSISYPDFI